MLLKTLRKLAIRFTHGDPRLRRYNSPESVKSTLTESFDSRWATDGDLAVEAVLNEMRGGAQDAACCFPLAIHENRTEHVAYWTWGIVFGKASSNQVFTVGFHFGPVHSGFHHHFRLPSIAEPGYSLDLTPFGLRH